MKFPKLPKTEYDSARSYHEIQVLTFVFFSYGHTDTHTASCKRNEIKRKKLWKEKHRPD